MAGERLAKMICDAKTPESDMTDIIYGEVTQTTPLTIKIDGSGYEITSEFTILSQMVKNMTKQYIDTDKEGVEQTRNIQIFSPLIQGDRVRMIKAHKSQLYYILDRF